jgi:hypothetical protein
MYLLALASLVGLEDPVGLLALSFRSVLLDLQDLPTLLAPLFLLSLAGLVALPLLALQLALQDLGRLGCPEAPGDRQLALEDLEGQEALLVAV